MSEFLAADIGGTNLRLARIKTGGHIADEMRVQVDFSQLAYASSEAAEAHIIETIESAMGSLLIKNNIAGIGIGFPGFFTGNTGVLASSPNLPQLHDFALAERLTNQLNIPVFVQNDALCAALGEFRFGAAKDKLNLLHLTLGTGVGAGLILAKKPYTGEHGMAMEFGHLCVVRDAQARACGCGNRGCVESYASATAVAQRYAELTGVHGKADAETIYRLACQGDNKATRILEEAGEYLGMAIAEAVKLLDVETVTISGGLTGAWDILHPRMIESLNRGLIPPLKEKIQILRSTLDDYSGLLGAATIAGA